MRRPKYWISALLLGLLSLGGPAALLAQNELESTLVNTERQLWEAWKTKSGQTFDQTLHPKAVSMGEHGLMDRAATIKEITTENCQVRSYTLTDTKATQIDKDTVLLTYKANQDATCDGQKIPAAVYASTVYEKSGDKWMPAFHQESPVPETSSPTMAPK
jgi:hypothetical protein